MKIHGLPVVNMQTSGVFKSERSITESSSDNETMAGKIVLMAPDAAGGFTPITSPVLDENQTHEEMMAGLSEEGRAFIREGEAGAAYGTMLAAMFKALNAEDMLLSQQMNTDIGGVFDQSFSLMFSRHDYLAGNPLTVKGSTQIHPQNEQIRTWLDQHADQVSALLENVELMSGPLGSPEDIAEYYQLSDDHSAILQKMEQLTESWQVRADRAEFELRSLTDRA